MTTPLYQLTRRRFLGTTAAAAGGILLPATRTFAAEPPSATPQEPSNDHFWYRPQPEGPFVDSQCDNKAFGYSDGEIFLSEDCGRTWPHRTPFADARNIVFSCILKNGNVLFSALARLYLSTDNLKTFKQITVKNADGSDYLPHTPQKAELPGWYFHSLTGVMTWDVKGREMLVWGNYCNVIGGATPVNIYYSTDQGRTVKIAYSFGHSSATPTTPSSAGTSIALPTTRSKTPSMPAPVMATGRKGLNATGCGEPTMPAATPGTGRSSFQIT